MVLCAGAFGCYAAQGSLPGAQGQGYDLNLSYSRTTLKAVADAITQQVGIAFSYETALAGYPMENLEVSEKGATIEAILAAVFTPRGIDYRVVDKVVVLTRSTRPVPAASAAAKSEVKGVVRDAAGNPMIGVTVTIKGTLVGVSTGVDGGYAIPADGNATLLFSYIGYRPHEEVVGRRTQIDVTMQEDELVMDEVVVVGYGTLKKRNIVGAVENLSGDAVENRPNANITRSLQGQIPGLNIVQVDGKADHAGEVTIRGVNNTFKARVSGGEKTNKLGQGGGALVLIDGAEGDMGSVNPDDIASISVLKDASSAAVYGARGAFGVILITTKDPEKGKVRVSYNGSVSLHRRTVIWEDNVVTDPVQWVDAFRESYLNSSPTATVPSLFNNYMPYSNAWFEELKRRRADPTMDNYDIDANGNYNYYGETNWLKEIYKSVNYSTTHAVSIQGGREGVSYYISGRYYNQDGIYKVGEETYKKYNLRAKGAIRIRPWLTLDNNTSLMSSKYHQPMVHYGQQVISRQIDMFAFPFALLKNPDGTWTQTAAKTGYAAFAEGTSWQENNKLEVANTTTFNFEFVPDVFKVSADVTYKGSRWSRDRMENLYTYYTGVNVSGQDNSFSSLENWTYRSDYISTNIVGTVTPKLGADHDLNVVAGWNLEDYDYRTQKTYRQGNLYPSKPSFTLMDGEYYSTTSGGYTWAGRILRPRQLRLCRPLPGRSERPLRRVVEIPVQFAVGLLPLGIGWMAPLRRAVAQTARRRVAGQLQGSRQHRFARQCQHRPLPVPRDHDRFGQRLDRQVVGHHQRPERTLHVGAQPDPRRHHLGKGHHLQHRPRPRPVPQPAFVHRRLLPPQYDRPLHRRPEPPAGTRKRRALRQLRQPQDQGMGAEPFVARLVQPGRQAVQLQHQGYAVGQPQLDHRLL